MIDPESCLRYVSEKSDFYRKKFAGSGLKEFSELPFTTKKEIIADQEAFPPFGSNICVRMEDVIRIHKTSGTTNKPVLIAMTAADIENTVKVGAECLGGAGVKTTDIVFHCLNYNMWAGGYTDHQSLEKTGATVVPFGVGNSEHLLGMMRHIGATGIHCTPSYMSKLEDVCRSSLGIDPSALGLRIGLFGGESGLQNPAFRKRLEDIWGIRAMNANYGLSEVLSIVAAECTSQLGLHFRADSVLHAELLDPQSQTCVPLCPGSIGELVLTNLHREAQPLIRYRSGDIVRILDGDCPCGSSDSQFRFEVVGRADDMFVYKGLNVFPGSIELVLGRFLDRISSTYQILISAQDPVDKFVIRIESLSTSTLDRGHLASELSGSIATTLGIRPDIDLVDEGAIPRSEGKHRKLIRCL
jgi:phenylacetate-CoA ligase